VIAVFVIASTGRASWPEAPGLLPEVELVAPAGDEGLLHPPAAFFCAAGGGPVADFATPAGKLGELLPGVHLDPARVALLARASVLGEALPQLAPHAGQQRGDELAEVAQSSGAQQEVRVATVTARRRSASSSPHEIPHSAAKARWTSISARRVDCASSAKRCTSSSRGARAQPSASKRPYSIRKIVLAHVEAKLLGTERAVTDATDERMLVLGLPDVRGGLPQLIAKCIGGRVPEQQLVGLQQTGGTASARR